MTKISGFTIIPGLRYRDAPAMIEWLCRAFGLNKHTVYPNDDGSIAHAQLTLGGRLTRILRFGVTAAPRRL